MIILRKELPGLLSRLDYKTGVEIGVWRAEFSEFILDNWGGHLTLVDCWEAQSDEVYFDIMNQPQNIQDQCYEEAVQRTRRFADRCEIYRGYSFEVGMMFQENERVFDFVFIDGNHSYEATKLDLEVWYPLVRSGGLVCGHDYLNADNACGSRFGVKSAVDEFIADNEVSDFFVTDEQWPTWGFIKL